MLFFYPFDLSKPQTQGESGLGFLHHTVPGTGIDAGRQHLNPMFARIPYNLCRGIESQGLRIQQGAGEDAGMMMFDP